MARVLVVDDEEGIRRTIGLFLKADGHDVETAANAAEASRLVSDGEFDVIVSDIMMPGDDGLHLLQFVRARHALTQFILITGEPTVDTAAEAVRLGAFDYLPKPVRRETVCRVVGKAAGEKDLREQNERLQEQIRRHNEGLERLIEERTSELKEAVHHLSTSLESATMLADRLLVVREEERTRIAREVHDLLAQDLTRLKIDLVWLHGRLAKTGNVPSAVRARVGEMAQAADAAIHCVQRIATELRPAVLDALGLCATVEWQARDFQDHAGIVCHATVPERDLSLDRNSATVAFRVLQECLTNVQRHANATRVDILLREEAGQLLLRVRDDGSGIEPATLASPLSVGLAGMRERAALLNGHLHIRSLPGAGTTIELRLPLATTENPKKVRA